MSLYAIAHIIHLYCAARRHYAFHQRHRHGIQPLPALFEPTLRHLIRYAPHPQNPVGSQHPRPFRHRRRQNGTAHPDRRLVQIHPRRRVFPYAVHRIFCQSHVLSVLVSCFQTTYLPSEVV